MRKEYRVCLNLNNLHHKYIEEQIQKEFQKEKKAQGQKLSYRLYMIISDLKRVEN